MLSHALGSIKIPSFLRALDDHRHDCAKSRNPPFGIARSWDRFLFPELPPSGEGDWVELSRCPLFAFPNHISPAVTSFPIGQFATSTW
jgi:hypothetical protein